ncbi:MAG: AP2/ERF family transcription factor [Pseudomonadota bacterium]
MKNLSTKKKCTNKTGVTGVSASDSFCYSYIVVDSGKRKSKKFSVTKYGKAEALRLAIKWRRDNELRIHGYSVIPAELARRNFKHKQSVLKANLAARNKKKVALENRQKTQQVFEQRKKECQNITEKYIYRVDDLEAGHGWQLKIQIGDVVVYDRVFRDNRYGTTSDAFKTAKEEKKRQLKLHNMPYAEGRRYRKKLHVANTSGVNGVSMSGGYYYSYIPVEPNKTKRRKFSINKYSEKLAFQLAVEWRKEMEAKIYNFLTNE